MAFEALSNAVQDTGEKLDLSQAAKNAFETRAGQVERLITALNSRVADENAAKYAAKLRGKLTVENASAVRQQVAARLSALMAALPARLAKHGQEANPAIKKVLENDERDAVIKELQQVIREELDAFINRVIEDPDQAVQLAQKLAQGVAQAGRGRHEQIASALEEAR